MKDDSKALGFVLGFFLGIIGLVIAILMEKPLTKKGAMIGFIVNIGGIIICAIYALIYWAIIFSGIKSTFDCFCFCL